MKKYGLVWENYPEPVEELLKIHTVKLDEQTNRRIEAGEAHSPVHQLIEGDNIESLTALQMTHKGRVDVIYIDPPYNTGNKFKYSDNYGHHSKWLSFMSKRLILAKELMSEDGVIFISIDDNEFAQLKLLCDEVFGESNFLECYIWNSNFRPDNSSKIYRKNGEFILCYAKNIFLIKELVGNIQEKYGMASLTKKKETVKEILFPGGFVKTFLSDGLYEKGIKKNGYELLDNVIVRNGLITNSFRLKGNMYWTQRKVDAELNAGTTILIKTLDFIPYYFKEGDSILRPTKIIPNDLVGDVLEGNSDLFKVFNTKKFDYPKPVSLIKYLLKTLSKQFNSPVILDFFAGSGTTGHAVLELNQEDGGNRQFILCTNNENNICEEVTYERLKRVINGYTTPKGKEVEGIPANLKYYKTKWS